MPSLISSIDAGSPASRAGMRTGEKLISVNGHDIYDILDYKFYTYDSCLSVITEADNGRRIYRIKKSEGEPLGLNFETYLMDSTHSCANRCVFCFVDQLPKGMRSTLYFKDDDARLSFLMGNYITLTNLSEREIRRIIDLHISPINVSVHATDPEMRAMLLGNKRGREGYSLMCRLAEAGIVMNCQIVCCPGLNDGEVLGRSMRELAVLYPAVNSVSIVPVGLTRYREGLYPLVPFDSGRAFATVKSVEAFASDCLEKYGSRIFFCSDELYLKAGLPVPEDEYYEEYPQLENGVGMLRLLKVEFDAALCEMSCEATPTPFSVATGVSAAPFIENLICSAGKKCDKINGTVYAVKNDFFGHTIDVAGLVTGQDLIAQLRGKQLGERLIIPQNMLRHGEGVFLDDVTLDDVMKELSVPVRVTAQDGFELCEAFFGL